MSNQPFSEQLRIERELLRDARHIVKLRKNALRYEKARRILEERADGKSIAEATMRVEGSSWFKDALADLLDAESKRDKVFATVQNLEDLLQDAREHDANRRAEMRHLS